MRSNLEQIKSVLHQHISFLKDHYNVEKIGIFGSVARKQESKGSDIDILVEFSKPVGFFKFIELEEFLSKILNRKVDLVTKKALKEVIREEVLAEAVYV